jgi:deazaflavin-dependent oxidoreductase (nitroreductase family)
MSRIEQIPAVRALGIRMLAAQQWVYERTDGRLGHRLLGMPSLLLRTTGARTGLTRTSGLIYARDGADYLVVPSNGGAARAPGWYHNLRARPQVEIQVGRRRAPATAAPVTPADPDFARLWGLANAVNHNRYRAYQKLTSRPIPVVRLTPTSTTA